MKKIIIILLVALLPIYVQANFFESIKNFVIDYKESSRAEDIFDRRYPNGKNIDGNVFYDQDDYDEYKEELFAQKYPNGKYDFGNLFHSIADKNKHRSNCNKYRKKHGHDNVIIEGKKCTDFTSAEFKNIKQNLSGNSSGFMLLWPEAEIYKLYNNGVCSTVASCRPYMKKMWPDKY